MHEPKGENGISAAPTSVLLFGLNIWAATPVRSTFGVPFDLGSPRANDVPLPVLSTLSNMLTCEEANLAVGPPNTHRLQPPNRAPIPESDTLIPAPSSEVRVFASYVDDKAACSLLLEVPSTLFGSRRPTPSWPGPIALTCSDPRKVAFLIPMQVPYSLAGLLVSAGMVKAHSLPILPAETNPPQNRFCGPQTLNVMGRPLGTWPPWLLSTHETRSALLGCYMFSLLHINFPNFPRTPPLFMLK